MNLNSIRAAMRYLVPLLAAAALLARDASATDVSRSLKKLQEEGINILENELPTEEVLPRFVRVTRRPAAARRRDGGVAKLVCEGLGKPAPSIVWLKNDEPIVEPELDSSERVSAAAGSVARAASTLLVRRGRGTDRYTCLVRAGARVAAASATVHSDGDTDSLSSRLLPLAPVIVSHYKVLLSSIGSRVELPCRARGHPRPAVSWRDARGRDVSRLPRMKVLHSGSLVISPLAWEDMGEYSCDARSRAGAAEAATFVYPIAA